MFFVVYMAKPYMAIPYMAIPYMAMPCRVGPGTWDQRGAATKQANAGKRGTIKVLQKDAGRRVCRNAYLNIYT